MDHELFLEVYYPDSPGTSTYGAYSESDRPAVTLISSLIGPLDKANISDLRTYRFAVRRPSSKIAACVLAVLLTAPTHGQVTRPRIVQKVTDDFSVERKTGRFALSTPEQISIGGTEDQALSVAYGPVDGTDFQQQGIPRLVYNQIRKEGTLNYYDYETIEFGDIGETFRRDAGTGPFVNQYPTGATLVASPGQYLFTDKNGVQISFTDADYTTTVTYPDGRQIRFIGGSDTVSFEDRDRAKRSIVNNYGYMLKFTNAPGNNNHRDIQAVNLAKNYCDTTSSTSCAGLSQIRQSSVDVALGVRTLTDAAGGVTKYNFQQLNAFDYERICYIYQDSWNCPDPPSWYRWYPISVALPDSTAPVYTISYEKKGDTHDDIFVKTVQKNDIIASYNTVKDKFGSWGSNPYNLAFNISTWVTINGQQTDYSKAVRPLPEWGSSRRSLLYFGDGLGRETKYSRNTAQEVSGNTFPEGNGELLEYDSRNNAITRRVFPKPGSGLAEQITQFTYPASCSAATITFCNKPTSVIDPRGGTTNYTYNSRGQILEEVGPAPSVGAARLKKVYTYELRTAYIIDASASLVPAGPAISLPVKIVTCDTTSSCLGTGADSTTLYDYGPSTGANNLNLRGVAVTALDSSGTAITTLTCYAYNYFGERISETRPNGGLANCS